MSVADVPDWTRAIDLVQTGGGPVSTADVPDWSDPIAVLAAGSPLADYPDFTKATTVTAGSLPGGTPPLASPYAWWDATQITGFNNNDPLTVWTDASANNHDITADGTFRPAYITSGINSKPCVNIPNQTAHQALIGSIVLAQPFSFIAVAQATTTSLNKFLFGWGGSDPYFEANGTLGQWELYAGGTPARTGSLDTNAHCLVAVFNGASSSFTIDGVTTSGLNPGTDGCAGNGFVLMSFGNISPNNGAWVGNMGEAILYGHALSAGEQSTVHTYAQGKWGTP